MSDIDLAISQCKELESILRTKHGADGKGLHQLVTSVESRLPSDLVRVLRRVATIRNKIVHEENYRRLDDRKAFGLCGGQEAAQRAGEAQAAAEEKSFATRPRAAARRRRSGRGRRGKRSRLDRLVLANVPE